MHGQKPGQRVGRTAMYNALVGELGRAVDDIRHRDACRAGLGRRAVRLAESHRIWRRFAH